MAPKRPAAAAASGSASDGEADSSHDHHSPSPSHSPTKTPPPNIRSNAAVLSSTPISAALDLAAVSDSEADAEGRLHSPRRSRERSPRLHSDFDNSAAASDETDHEDNTTPPRRSGPRSSLVDPHSIKPISSRLMERPSSQRRSKRPRNSLLSLPRGSVLSTERKKRPPRIWSPKDEITILRSLISYRSKKGALPANSQETGKLHSQIRDQLSADATTTQLSDKVRRLKHKFRLLVSRTKDGEDPELPTIQERDVYELSKMVWGVDGAGRAAYGNYWFGDSDEEPKSGESDEEQDMEGGLEGPDRGANRRLKGITFSNGNAKGKEMYPYLSEAVEELSKEHPSGTAFRKALDVLEGSRALAMEEKLEKFKLSEIKLQLRRMDLMKETVKMVLDALEGTN